MCWCLRIQKSGIYAWLNAPQSKRSREDRQQTELLKEGWAASGKVQGHSNLHDNTVGQSERIFANRVARLTRLGGIKEQIGKKRFTGKYGGKPSVAVNETFNRPV